MSEAAGHPVDASPAPAGAPSSAAPAEGPRPAPHSDVTRPRPYWGLRPRRAIRRGLTALVALALLAAIAAELLWLLRHAP